MESSINSAIQRGFFQQVRYLLDLGLEANARDPEDRRTPLINCALVEEEAWGVGIARMLIEHDACIGLKDKFGLNAFHYACLYERVELVKVYLKAIDFDLNGKDRQGNTALHYIVTTDNEELLRLVVEALIRYKLPVDVPNKRGVTPLIHAYRTFNVRIGDLLVELGHADLDIKDGMEFKSAQEWKQEVLYLLDEQRQSLKRPRSAFSRLQMHQSTPRFNQSLYQSSPNQSINQSPRLTNSYTNSKPRFTRASSALSTRRSGSPSFNGSFMEKENCATGTGDDAIVTQKRLGAKLFRSASSNDLRNKPEYILNVSPLNNFKPGNSYQYGSRQGQFLQHEDGSWRFKMKQLYKDYDYQFTKTFRKAAKTPSHMIGVHPLRALSPNTSSDHLLSPEGGRTSKGGRRSSMRSPTAEGGSRRSRIGSAASNRAGSRRGSLISAHSTSSNESVTSVAVLKQPKRKNSQDLKDDISSSDASTNSNKSDKAKGGPEPARPTSRATHHPKETAGHNLTAIKEEKG